jgi:hypothetical protein
MMIVTDNAQQIFWQENEQCLLSLWAALVGIGSCSSFLLLTGDAMK